jgi:hypothetical protein
MNGEMTREQALDEFKKVPYNINEMQYDKQYVLKKLEMTSNEFEEYFSRPNKYYFNYPSYMGLLKTFNKFSISGIKKVLPFTPSIFIENQNR